MTELMAPYPNPINPSTKVRFALAERGHVDLNIFNVRGELVRELASETFDVGVHQITWGGRDEHERQVASGVYLVQMKSNGGVQSQRMVLVR